MTVRYRIQSLLEVDVFHWVLLARHAARSQECLPRLDVPAVLADGQSSCSIIIVRAVSQVQYNTSDKIDGLRKT